MQLHAQSSLLCGVHVMDDLQACSYLARVVHFPALVEHFSNWFHEDVDLFSLGPGAGALLSGMAASVVLPKQCTHAPGGGCSVLLCFSHVGSVVKIQLGPWPFLSAFPSLSF